MRLKIYTIVAGDTCWDVATKNNITMTELLILNPELNYYNLIVGMKIYVKENLDEVITEIENLKI